VGVLVDAVRAIKATVDHELPFALMEGAEIVATSAQTAHRYRNRTGRLQANTRVDGVRGSLADGYRIRVVGATPYGSFLEEGTSRIEGYEFLLPAWERTQYAVAEVVSRRLVVRIS
jgi:Bacteriophage HK97-gp10, putative tail-component